MYSTEETRIGTWIDGKPLYRRVFQIENYNIRSPNGNANYYTFMPDQSRTIFPVNIYGTTFANGEIVQGALYSSFPYKTFVSDRFLEISARVNFSTYGGVYIAPSLSGTGEIMSLKFAFIIVVEYTKTTD